MREEEGVFVGGLRVEAEEEDLLDFLRIETGEGAAATVDMVVGKTMGSGLGEERGKEGGGGGGRASFEICWATRERAEARRQGESGIFSSPSNVCGADETIHPTQRRFSRESAGQIQR